MKRRLAIAAMSSLFLTACDSIPADFAAANEAPISTAASLVANGTLGDWSNTPSDEKVEFLEAVAGRQADAIIRRSPSTTAEDAMTASVTYFRQCMDSYLYAGFDHLTTTIDIMLARCEARFDPADAQRFLGRVYEAKKVGGAETQDVAWSRLPPAPVPAPEPAKKTDDELCEDPCFGE